MPIMLNRYGGGFVAIAPSLQKEVKYMSQATTQRMIMIPAWRYYKMLETYDEAVKEIEELKRQIQKLSIKEVDARE